jgi:hypothetical protein
MRWQKMDEVRFRHLMKPIARFLPAAYQIGWATRETVRTSGVEFSSAEAAARECDILNDCHDGRVYFLVQVKRTIIDHYEILKKIEEDGI